MPILRDKNGKFIKGHSGYKFWLGKTIYPSMKEAVRKAKLGHKQSKQLVKKRVEARKGYRHTEQTKKKIGLGNLGKKRSREICEKNSKAHLGINAGKNHYNWQNGKTNKNMKIRNSFEYKQWRKAVFERDNYTCQECGRVGGELHADHIKPFADYPKLRLRVSNGRTLCIPCHKKTSNYLNLNKK